MAIESSALTEAGLPGMGDPTAELRAAVIEAMVDAGYPPRSTTNSKVYRKRLRDQFAVAPPPSGTPAVRDDEVECYTVMECAALLKIKEGKIRQLILGGAIPSFKLDPDSDDRRVRKCDLAAWIKRRMEDN